MKKVTWNGFTAKQWSDKLVGLMQQDIKDDLPKEVQGICNEAAVKLRANFLIPGVSGGAMGSIAAQSVVYGGALAIGLTAVPTLGLSLVALPGCLGLAYLYSQTWSREAVIRRVVFRISEDNGDDLCAKSTSQFSSYVDQKVEEIQEFFEDM